MKTYLETIQKCINWINTQMLTFDGGYYGIYERIRIDEHLRTNWSRPDCNTEYLRVLSAYRELTGTQENDVLSEKILCWLERTQDTRSNSVWKGSFPFYLIDGYIVEKESSTSVYQNDNGKIINVLCDLYEKNKDERFLKMARDLADYWVKAQQPDGTYGVIDGCNMQMCRKGACFVIWPSVGLYHLYEVTGEQRYLDAAEKGMQYLFALRCDGKESGRVKTSYEVPGQLECWRPVSSETSMFLYTLAIGYRATGKAEYLEQLHQTAAYVLRLQHSDGGILNCCTQDSSASLQCNPDLCDLVYTEGFALQALILSYQVCGEKRYLEAAKKLATFLCSIQCEGESPLWDGGWRGSYNVATKKWDGRANMNNAIDEGGMYSVYTGWCATNIVYGLEQLLLIEKEG